MMVMVMIIPAETQRLTHNRHSTDTPVVVSVLCQCCVNAMCLLRPGGDSGGEDDYERRW